MRLSSGLIFFYSLSKHCVKLKSLSLRFLTKQATLQKLHSQTSPGLLIALWTRPISDLTCKSVSNIWDTFRTNSVSSLFPKAWCIMFVCSSSLVFKLGADISLRMKIQRLWEIRHPHRSSSTCATKQMEQKCDSAFSCSGQKQAAGGIKADTLQWCFPRTRVWSPEAETPADLLWPGKISSFPFLKSLAITILA